MAKDNQRQLERASQALLAEAVHEVAAAVRYGENSRSSQQQMDREADDRGRLAEKLMEWGNLVFAGLVIAQAFSDKFDFVLAFVGAVVFAGAYFFAYWLTRGGGHT
jgi:hypothetical protein